MYLGTLLCNNQLTKTPETYAALALMYFHAARIESRLTMEGGIILLAEQDRSKWNLDWIEKGNAYMNMAAYGDGISSYHIEAAIAYEHCIAPSFEKTNWLQILRYYDMLAAMHPDPVVMLNRMTVIYKLYGAEQTLSEMNMNPFQNDWKKHYLYHSLLGEIYSGFDKDQTRICFEESFRLTKSETEKKLLLSKMDKMNQS